MPEADDPRRFRLSLPWDARGGLEAQVARRGRNRTRYEFAPIVEC
jgi:hypothetical protein